MRTWLFHGLSVISGSPVHVSLSVFFFVCVCVCVCVFFWHVQLAEV